MPEVRSQRFAYPALSVIAGEPVAEALACEAEHRSAKRLAIFANRALGPDSDTGKALAARLGDRVAAYAGLTAGHVDAGTVLSAAETARTAGADMIVAIGSGGVVDTVKLVLLCLAEDVHDAEALAELRMRPSAAGKPTVFPAMRRLPTRAVVVPTTLAAAQFTDFTDCRLPDGRRSYFRIPGASAETLVLDPALAVLTPTAVWLASGMKAIDHAVESVCSLAPVALVDATCLHALRILAPALRRTRANPADVTARYDALIAMWLAGAGMGGRVPVGASHGFAHLLTAIAGLSHGVTTGTILPAVLRYNASVNAAAQAECAAALGAPERALAEVVADLVRDLGLPDGLAAAGVRREDLPLMAEAAVGHFIVRNNPRPIRSAEEALAILNDAW